MQADKSIIRAIDLEFATVYYAAHDLAYGMAGTCIKGAAAKRTFVRAYIEELSGAPATDEEVDSLALDAELFALPMHIGPLCCLHGECKKVLNEEEDDDGEPIALRHRRRRARLPLDPVCMHPHRMRSDRRIVPPCREGIVRQYSHRTIIALRSKAAAVREQLI